MTADQLVTVAMTETVNEITLTHARLAELLGVDLDAVPALLANVEQWSPEAGPIEGQHNLLDEIDCDTYRACSENRSWAAWPTGHITPTIADDTVARSVSQLARQSRALLELASAYDGNTYRLLRDLGDHLGVSLAYVDRATINAHLDRNLSDLEWAAINDQFTALDFDDHIGDQGRFRAEWIETVLDKAGVPGYGYTAYGQPRTSPVEPAPPAAPERAGAVA